MKTEYVIYVVLSLCTAIALTLRTDRRLLGSIIVFFIFTESVLKSIVFSVDMSALPFDLQPRRILFFVMLLFITLSIFQKIIMKKDESAQKKPLFEILLYLYLLSVFISLIYNYKIGRIQGTALLSPLADIILFILLYHVMKNMATDSLREALLKCLMIFSIFVSLIAIYQLFIDSAFLKTCPPRYAFGGIIRSTGVLSSEYELGFFLTFMIIVFLTKYRGKPILFMTLPILILALFSTFHRLNWLIFFICIPSYLFLSKDLRIISLRSYVLLMLCIIISFTYFVCSDLFTKLSDGQNVQAFTKGRLLEDTVTGRLRQFAVTADAIHSHLLGLGSYKTKEYYNLMAKHDMVKGDNIPLGVHNGYLAVGIKYGFVAMTTLVGVMVSMLLYFKRHISLDRPVTLYPFFMVFIWMMANISQGMADFNRYFVLLVAIVCGSFVSVYGTGERSNHSEPKTSE